MHRVTSRLIAGALMLAPSVALAHPGHDEAAGFLHGFMHPVGGIDHILAMVAVGILAYQFGGRALWLLPTVFIVVMGMGWILGAVGMHLPLAETGIAVSVIVMGAMIAFGIRTPVMIAAALAGIFAIFHGFAHGTEMPQAGSAALYAAGFTTATALLHLVGIGLGLAIAQVSREYGSSVLRIAGCLVAVAGAAILTQVV